MKFGVIFIPIATIPDYVEMEINSGQIKLAISTFPASGLTSMSPTSPPPPPLKLFFSTSLRTKVKLLTVLRDHQLLLYHKTKREKLQLCSEAA